MQPSIHIPKKIAAKSFEELSKQLLKIQIAEGGRVKILKAGQDKDGNWYYIYYPLVSFGGSDL